MTAGMGGVNMNRDRMLHDANQIALFFGSYPREEAIAGIADHLKKFWAPRVRREIEEYVEQGGGLNELAVAAVREMQCC
jgi:formate dehydrogenase subunit delta